jgi:hypothetical protein
MSGGVKDVAYDDGDNNLSQLCQRKMLSAFFLPIESTTLFYPIILQRRIND